VVVVLVAVAAMVQGARVLAAVGPVA
jgi:hypothetical protein